MNIKQMLYVLWQKITKVQKTNITPLVGSNYPNYGNSYYQVWGKHVQIHLGLQGLPANTTSHVFTIPEGLRPVSHLSFRGQGAGALSVSGITIGTDGKIMVRPGTGENYVEADIIYLTA